VGGDRILPGGALQADARRRLSAGAERAGRNLAQYFEGPRADLVLMGDFNSVPGAARNRLACRDRLGECGTDGADLAELAAVLDPPAESTRS